MDIRKISPGLSVSPQLLPSEMEEIRAQGFRSVICNRPDAEGPDQPGHDEMQAAADAAGLQFLYLPVTPGMVTDMTAEAFGIAGL